MLDFLLNNWLFTLIILWFLFGLFGQGNRQKARREQHKHPAASKRQQELTLRTQTDREETKRKLSDEAKRMARELQTRLEEVQQTWGEQQEVFAEKVEEFESDTSPHPYAREDEDPYLRENQNPYEREVERPYKRPVQRPYRYRQRAVKVLPTDRESLKRGIIWAEVLGKPRAKRPYRPPYSRQN